MDERIFGRMDVIYQIKQDIPIYILHITGQTVGPIGLSFFCGNSWVGGGVIGKKKSNFFQHLFFSNLFCHGQRRAL